MLIWICVIIACVILDQVSKIIISNTYALGECHEIIKGVLNFRYIRNKGAAWGMFSDARWVFILITLIALIIMPYFLYKYRKAHVMFSLSLSFLIGGAVGNMIDRVFLGSVVDFIEAAFMDFPIFNIADCFVTIGAIMLFVYLTFIDKTIFGDTKKDKKTEPSNKDNENAADSNGN